MLTKRKVYFLCSYYFNDILRFKLKDFKLVRGPFGPRLVERHYCSTFMVYGFNPDSLCASRKICKDIGMGNSRVLLETEHNVSLPLLLHFKISF